MAQIDANYKNPAETPTHTSDQQTFKSAITKQTRSVQTDTNGAPNNVSGATANSALIAQNILSTENTQLVSQATQGAQPSYGKSQIIQIFSSPRFSGREFVLYQVQNKTTGAWELRIHSARKRLIPDILVFSSNRPLTREDFGRKSALWANVRALEQVLNDDRNVVAEFNAPSGVNFGNIGDVVTGATVGTVIELVGMIAGLPEQAVRTSRGLGASIVVGVEEFADAIQSGDQTRTGLDNPLNYEQELRELNTNKTREAIHSAEEGITSFLNADRTSVAYGFGRLIGPFLLTKGRGQTVPANAPRLRGEITPETVKLAAQTASPQEIARGLASVSDDALRAGLRQNPDVYTVIESRLQQFPSDKTAQWALQRLRNAAPAATSPRKVTQPEPDVRTGGLTRPSSNSRLVPPPPSASSSLRIGTSAPMAGVNAITGNVTTAATASNPLPAPVIAQGEPPVIGGKAGQPFQATQSNLDALTAQTRQFNGTSDTDVSLAVPVQHKNGAPATIYNYPNLMPGEARSLVSNLGQQGLLASGWNLEDVFLQNGIGGSGVLPNGKPNTPENNLQFREANRYFESLSQADIDKAVQSATFTVNGKTGQIYGAGQLPELARKAISQNNSERGNVSLLIPRTTWLQYRNAQGQVVAEIPLHFTEGFPDLTPGEARSVLSAAAGWRDANGDGVPEYYPEANTVRTEGAGIPGGINPDNYWDKFLGISGLSEQGLAEREQRPRPDTGLTLELPDVEIPPSNLDFSKPIIWNPDAPVQNPASAQPEEPDQPDQRPEQPKIEPAAPLNPFPADQRVEEAAKKYGVSAHDVQREMDANPGMDPETAAARVAGRVFGSPTGANQAGGTGGTGNNNNTTVVTSPGDLPPEDIANLPVEELGRWTASRSPEEILDLARNNPERLEAISTRLHGAFDENGRPQPGVTPNAAAQAQAGLVAIDNVYRNLNQPPSIQLPLDPSNPLSPKYTFAEPLFPNIEFTSPGFTQPSGTSALSIPGQDTGINFTDPMTGQNFTFIGNQVFARSLPPDVIRAFPIVNTRGGSSGIGGIPTETVERPRVSISLGNFATINIWRQQGSGENLRNEITKILREIKKEGGGYNLNDPNVLDRLDNTLRRILPPSVGYSINAGGAAGALLNPQNPIDPTSNPMLSAGEYIEFGNIDTLIDLGAVLYNPATKLYRLNVYRDSEGRYFVKVPLEYTLGQRSLTQIPTAPGMSVRAIETAETRRTLEGEINPDLLIAINRGLNDPRNIQIWSDANNLNQSRHVRQINFSSRISNTLRLPGNPLNLYQLPRGWPTLSQNLPETLARGGRIVKSPENGPYTTYFRTWDTSVLPSIQSDIPLVGGLGVRTGNQTVTRHNLDLDNLTQGSDLTPPLPIGDVPPAAEPRSLPTTPEGEYFLTTITSGEIRLRYIFPSPREVKPNQAVINLDGQEVVIPKPVARAMAGDRLTADELPVILSYIRGKNPGRNSGLDLIYQVSDQFHPGEDLPFHTQQRLLQLFLERERPRQ